METHGEALAAGTFARPEAPDGDAAAPPPEAPPDGAVLYGVPLVGDGLVFVFDWSMVMTVPCDHEFEETRTMHVWHTGDRGWYDDHLMHSQALAIELRHALESAPAALRFAIVLLNENLVDAKGRVRRDLVVGQREFLGPDARGRKEALRLVEMQHPGWGLQHPEFSGLLLAFRIAGVGTEHEVDIPEPAVESFILVGDGKPKGGRFVLPDHELHAFARLNRFRRIAVDTVHISYDFPEWHRRMEGIARVSHGTYRRAASPPAR
jgi:hypothetical protein